MKEKNVENLKKIEEKQAKGEKLNFKERNILNIIAKRKKTTPEKLEYTKNIKNKKL